MRQAGIFPVTVMPDRMGLEGVCYLSSRSKESIYSMNRTSLAQSGCGVKPRGPVMASSSMLVPSGFRHAQLLAREVMSTEQTPNIPSSMTEI